MHLQPDHANDMKARKTKTSKATPAARTPIRAPVLFFPYPTTLTEDAIKYLLNQRSHVPSRALTTTRAEMTRIATFVHFLTSIGVTDTPFLSKEDIIDCTFRPER
jgi:hypothetical protein